MERMPEKSAELGKSKETQLSSELLELATSVDQRRPVVDLDGQLPEKRELREQWYLMTEAIKQDCVTTPSVRRELMKLCTAPVDQVMTDRAVTNIAEIDPRVARLAGRFEAKLGAFLALDEVPEDVISPDITAAEGLKSPIEDAELYAELERQGVIASAADRLRKNSERGAYTRGLAYPERRVVSERYAFGRDLKILALEAELIEHGTPEVSSDGEFVLSSGIHGQFDARYLEKSEQFLNPANWVSRKQSKDRVYEIEVAGETYLLKERKTARHTDTKRHGHVEGATSAQEFETGQNLSRYGGRHEDGLKLSWERPVGYVEYPDGFSFGVFEFEEGIEPEAPTYLIRDSILEHSADFEAEYHQIQEVAKTFSEHPFVVQDQHQNAPRKQSWIRKIFRRQSKNFMDEISFETFAEVKTRRMVDRSKELLNETVLGMGYQNTDTDGFGYRFNADKCELEIVGFDYEYYSALTPEQKQENLEYYQSGNDTHYEIIIKSNYDRSRKQERAMYLAMLEMEGRLPDGIKHMNG